MDKIEKNETYLSLSNETLTIENLKYIGGHKKLSVLWLQNCQIQDGSELRKIKDEDLEYLSNLTRIQDFSITNSEISDKGLKSLLNFPKLKFLNFDRSKINGSGFNNITQLENLETIWLRHSALNDENLVCFEHFPKLKTLLIQFSEVTHEGLFSLAKMKHLTIAAGGIFTNEDIIEFRKKQIESTIDAPTIDKNIEDEVTELISEFMKQITSIEEELEKLNENNAAESLKEERFKKFNDVFDRLCDEKAVRRYTPFGCSYELFSYRDYVPLIIHQVSKSKLHAYYLADESPVRFQLVLKGSYWKLLDRQKSINNKWRKVGL